MVRADIALVFWVPTPFADVKEHALGFCTEDPLVEAPACCLAWWDRFGGFVVVFGGVVIGRVGTKIRLLCRLPLVIGVLLMLPLTLLV